MSISREEAEKVVAGLTKAQRADILDSAEGFFWTADGRTLRGVERRGLIERTYNCRGHWTPLGIACRNLLSERDQ